MLSRLIKIAPIVRPPVDPFTQTASLTVGKRLNRKPRTIEFHIATAEPSNVKARNSKIRD